MGTLSRPPRVSHSAASALTRWEAQRLGFAAGVVAALCMLAAIVLLRPASGRPSLPEILADGILLLLPGQLFATLLDTLQHAAKPLLFLSEAVGIVVVGGLLGRWYGVRPRR